MKPRQWRDLNYLLVAGSMVRDVKVLNSQQRTDRQAFRPMNQRESGNKKPASWCRPAGCDGIGLTLLFVLFVSGCKEPAPPPMERIRTVQTIIVSEAAIGQLRKFPGTVKAINTSAISFEVSGLVQEVRVDIGNRVKKGQVLAVLDKQSFALNVASAKAALSRAQARFKEKQTAYERELRIQAQDAGATSQRAVDQALAAYESTRQDVSYNQAQLDLARRDLEKTELRAPFDGVIALRSVEPFEEVDRGKAVFEVFIEGAMEVEVKIPENLIGNIRVGLSGEVRLPNRPEKVYQAVISEVGSAATNANAFPVKAVIKNSDNFIQPGMTAEFSVVFTADKQERAYLVPMHALAPGTTKTGWSVFLVNPKSSTVHRTPVEAQGLIGDQAIIRKGVSPGDILVVAGVSFLRDGQKVNSPNLPRPEQSSSTTP